MIFVQGTIARLWPIIVFLGSEPISHWTETEMSNFETFPITLQNHRIWSLGIQFETLEPPMNQQSSMKYGDFSSKFMAFSNLLNRLFSRSSRLCRRKWTCRFLHRREGNLHFSLLYQWRYLFGCRESLFLLYLIECDY